MGIPREVGVPKQTLLPFISTPTVHLHSDTAQRCRSLAPRSAHLRAEVQRVADGHGACGRAARRRGVLTGSAAHCSVQKSSVANTVALSSRHRRALLTRSVEWKVAQEGNSVWRPWTVFLLNFRSRNPSLQERCAWSSNAQQLLYLPQCALSSPAHEFRGAEPARGARPTARSESRPRAVTRGRGLCVLCCSKSRREAAPPFGPQVEWCTQEAAPTRRVY